jgi:hypothetical protein
MTSASTDTVRNSASEAIDQLQRAATPALKEAKRQAGVLVDEGGEVIDLARARASETVADLGNSVIAFTKKNPLAALVIAAGAGALLISASKIVSSRR